LKVAIGIDSHKRSLAAAAVDEPWYSRPPKASRFARSQFRRRVWAPAIKAAGLEPLRIHDLRHSAVAFWIAAGASPKEIAVRAGHTSVAVVLDRYGPASRHRGARHRRSRRHGLRCDRCSGVDSAPSRVGRARRVSKVCPGAFSRGERTAVRVLKSGPDLRLC
jgi:Phage integrase family